MTDTQEDVVTRLESSAERARKIAGGSSGGSQIVLMAQAELYESAAAEITSLRSQNKGMREALCGSWAVVYLDGRNEHGSHVLPMPGTNLGAIEKFESGLPEYAEQILTEAEMSGHAVGHCVVTTWRWVQYGDYYDDSGWEYVGLSAVLTELLCGAPEEQNTQLAELPALSPTSKEETENVG